MPKLDRDNPRIVTKDTKKKAHKPAPKPELTTKSKRKKANSKNDASDKPIVYKELKVSLRSGDEQLTAEQAKELLGWEQEGALVKFGEDYLFVDDDGNKVATENNLKNRPFDHSLAKAYASNILKGQWKLNGETIVIDEQANIQSGQHRLVGLVIAAKEWEKNPEAYPFWESAPTLPCIIVTGTSGADDVVNTLDNVRQRTLADVLYRSEWLAKFGAAERNKISKVLSYALKQFAYRAASFHDAFVPGKFSHSDALDLLDRHSKLYDCVKHVYEEDKKEDGVGAHISAILPPGTAAALMYLMATSSTDPEKYRSSAIPTEKLLKFDNYDKAEEFFTLIAGDSPEVSAIKKCRQQILTEGHDNPNERIALVVKAWNARQAGKKVSTATIALKYVDENGKDWKDEDAKGNPADASLKVLAETPTVGGIDYGTPDNANDPNDVPDKESVQESIKRINAERLAKKKGGSKAEDKTEKPAKGKKKAKPPVDDSDDEEDDEDVAAEEEDEAAEQDEDDDDDSAEEETDDDADDDSDEDEEHDEDEEELKVGDKVFVDEDGGEWKGTVTAIEGDEVNVRDAKTKKISTHDSTFVSKQSQQ